MQRFMTATLFAGLLTGCVSKEHKALRAAFNDLSAEHLDLKAKLDSEARENNLLKGENQALDQRNDALAGANAELETDVQRKERALRELQARQDRARARVAEYQDLVERFAALIDSGALTVDVVDGRMVVQLPTDILFPSGSAELSDDGQAQLAEVGKVLSGLDREFQIEGHTDSDPISTARFPSNWELASARATTVLRVLSQAGVPADQLSAAGFSDTRPAAPNDTDENKRQNRRIEIALVPDMSLLPGFDALTAAARDGSVDSE